MNKFEIAYQEIYEILENSFKGSEIDNMIWLFANGQWRCNDLKNHLAFYSNGKFLAFIEEYFDQNDKGAEYNDLI